MSVVVMMMDRLPPPSRMKWGEKVSRFLYRVCVCGTRLFWSTRKLRKDLSTWKDEGYSFIAKSDFWGQQDFWAPDVYEYEGRYYLFTTFSNAGVKRGTSILVSDSPKGPFTPLVNKAITPSGWMCLDGSLYIDKEGNPWLLFCREWLETIDGEI